eukprot:jgi/Chrpa1/3418/Chrysochromulina_OHIO_Genome00004220-RA
MLSRVLHCASRKLLLLPARTFASQARLIVESNATEPLKSAELLLRHTLEAFPTTPVRLGEASQGGVRVVLSTLSDVDAVGVLEAAMAGRNDWSVVATRRGGSGVAFHALLQAGESVQLQLQIPHSLEMISTSERPMLARPRLQPGWLTFEAPRLSMQMAKALATAAQRAMSREDVAARSIKDGPLIALDNFLKTMPALSAPPAAPESAAAAEPLAPNPWPAAKKPSWVNEAAAAASAAAAAVVPPLKVPSAPGSSPAPARGARASSSASSTTSPDTARPPAEDDDAHDDALTILGELGVRVYPAPAPGTARATDGWSSLAGAEHVREAVEEGLLFPLKHPEAFEHTRRGTRAGEAVTAPRPTALLFFGPPGTGKTMAARLAAEAAELPLVAAPLEALISKWYGEGEQKLATLFARCEQLGPCVLFLDEIDALGGTRAKEMHEASRRMLSTLLRHMDGLDAGQHVALIGATNRPRDLDPALISRFDVRVSFPAPDAAGRASIFARYARQLDANALSQLGDRATGLSGRDILNVCKSAERKWVCSRLRAGAPMGPDELPPLEPYQEAVTRYLEGMTVQEAGEQEQRRGSGGTGMMMASEGV